MAEELAGTSLGESTMKIQINTDGTRAHAQTSEELLQAQTLNALVGQLSEQLAIRVSKSPPISTTPDGNNQATVYCNGISQLSGKLVEVLSDIRAKLTSYNVSSNWKNVSDQATSTDIIVPPLYGEEETNSRLSDEGGGSTEPKASTSSAKDNSTPVPDKEGYTSVDTQTTWGGGCFRLIQPETDQECQDIYSNSGSFEFLKLPGIPDPTLLSQIESGAIKVPPIRVARQVNKRRRYNRSKTQEDLPIKIPRVTEPVAPPVAASPRPRITVKSIEVNPNSQELEVHTSYENHEYETVLDSQPNIHFTPIGESSGGGEGSQEEVVLEVAEDAPEVMVTLEATEYVSDEEEGLDTGEEQPQPAGVHIQEEGMDLEVAQTEVVPGSAVHEVVPGPAVHEVVPGPAVHEVIPGPAVHEEYIIMEDSALVGEEVTVGEDVTQEFLAEEEEDGEDVITHCTVCRDPIAVSAKLNAPNMVHACVPCHDRLGSTPTLQQVVTQRRRVKDERTAAEVRRKKYGGDTKAEAREYCNKRLQRCDRCGRTFVTWRQLMSHASEAHGVNLLEISCDLCRKHGMHTAFRRPEELKQHKQALHGQFMVV